MQNIPIALQMYTVRNEAKEDFVGTLQKVAALGYKGIELAGTYGHTAQGLRGILDDLNLEVAGSHVSIDELNTNLTAALDYNAELRNDTIVCPWLPEHMRRSAADYSKVAEFLTEVGEECQEQGMELCYHNHAFEFEKFNGEYALDMLFRESYSDLVKSELDTYWVEYGGESAVEYIRKYADRLPLVHLKDMAADEKRSFAEVGEGTLDFHAIIHACREAGVDWLIVEQDACQRPPFESIEISLNNLRKMGYA
jgi:sugar phosphate isomerase/epimerase